MRAEVIAIGDELTSGQRLDTNSRWISQRLGDLGIRVLYHSTVGDDIAANVSVFRNAVERADLIIATGGLGPTADDLTRQALADAAEVELVMDPESLAHIRRLFERRGREMPDRNVIQAMFPRGAEAIPNPQGTAPGIHQTFSHTSGRNDKNSFVHVFALPGVPAEMREMWEATVEPQIGELLGGKRRMIRHHRIKCFGVGESDLESMLPDLIRRGRQPTVGITVSQATITLRITAEAENIDACQSLISPTSQTIHECLGNLIFGTGDDELQHAIIRLLKETGMTIATSEKGTGGMISQWLSSLDDQGQIFRGGMVGCMTPDLSDSEAQSTILAAHLVRKTHGTDIGLAIGRFPPPNADPPGVVHVALVRGDAEFQETFKFSGHSDILQARAAKRRLI